jgi:hypothetical protein
MYVADSHMTCHSTSHLYQPKLPRSLLLQTSVTAPTSWPDIAKLAWPIKSKVVHFGTACEAGQHTWPRSCETSKVVNKRAKGTRRTQRADLSLRQEVDHYTCTPKQRHLVAWQNPSTCPHYTDIIRAQHMLGSIREHMISNSNTRLC